MRLLWAKTKSKDSQEYHPVLNHCVDVAQVARLIWSRCLNNAIRSRLSKDLGVLPSHAEIVVGLLAGLHDLGKASPAFQMLRADLSAHLAEAGLELPQLSTHKPHGIVTAVELKRLLLNADRCISGGRVTSGVVAQIAGAHHGVFPQALEMRGLGTDSLGSDSWAHAREQMAIELWQALKGAEVGQCSFGEREPEDPATVPLLAGLISVADWIGSDTKLFPFDNNTPLNEYSLLASRRAETALQEHGWLPALECAQRAEFSRVFPFSPNALQVAVSGLVADSKEPYLLVVEAQMGQGKTEAALYAADLSLCSGGSRGLYVALPTQATSNAMYARVRNDYLESRGHSGRLNLQLVHGSALLGDVVRMTDVHGGTADSDSSVSAQSWFTARKRPLLAPFGVGTIDQSLLSVLQTKHWFVRLFGLANKTVIFDEVHAYDTYMTTILERLLQWLAAVDCSVVILSATLPRSRLRALVKAYSGHEVDCVPKYPRVTLATREGVVPRQVPTDGGQKCVRLEIASPDPDTIARLLSERLRDGGCAAVICNTVDRAQSVYLTLSDALDDCECLLFHARTPFAWRQEIETAVLEKFGKPDSDGASPHRPPKAVLVATSVVEQSLDLDFDWILTDMAPVDLLLQRLGREHRHERATRPTPVSEPVLTILSDGIPGGPPPAFEHSSIYERYVLLRSWLEVAGRSAISLPDDIDQVVQGVYEHSEPAVLSSEWAEALANSKEQMEHRRAEDSRKADRILIDKPGYPEDLIAQFNKQLGEDEDPNTHASVKAATRDGDPSIQIVCLRVEGDRTITLAGSADVDFDVEPGKQLTESLLKSSLSIQQKGLFHTLAQQLPPPGWSESPHLRFSRAVVFNDNVANVGRYKLSLDRDLGLVVKKEEQ